TRFHRGTHARHTVALNLDAALVLVVPLLRAERCQWRESDYARLVQVKRALARAARVLPELRGVDHRLTQVLTGDAENPVVVAVDVRLNVVRLLRLRPLRRR